MDRTIVMMLMLLASLITILLFLAFFARAPIFSSLVCALLYTLYLFVANEKAGVHNAQGEGERELSTDSTYGLTTF